MVQKIIILLIVISVSTFNLSIQSQSQLKKINVERAFNEIKSTAYYPETWRLVEYKIYKGKKSRLCLDLAMIKVQSQNMYGVPFYSYFTCYFIYGRQYYHLKTEEDSYLLFDFWDQESFDGLTEGLIQRFIDVEKAISREELCKTDEETKKDQEEAKQKQQIEKRTAELKLKDKEILSSIEVFMEAKNYLKAYEKFGELYFPENFTSKAILIEALSLYYSARIDTLVSKNDFTSAIVEYKKIIDLTIKKANQKKIQTGIDSYNSNIELPMETAMLTDILVSKSIKLDTLSAGSHVFKISCDGKLTINGKSTSITIPLTTKYYDTQRFFTVCNPQVITLAVTLQETVISKNIITGFVASGNKNVLKTKDNELYIGKIKTTEDKLNTVNTTYNKSISTKEYQVIEVIEVKKFLQGTQILTTKNYEKKGEIKQFKSKKEIK
jgi:hypothetical protein